MFAAAGRGDEPAYAGYQVDVDLDGDWDALLILVYEKREAMVVTPYGMDEFRERLTDGLANTQGFEGIRFFVTREHRNGLETVRGEVERSLGLKIHDAVEVEVLNEPHSERVRVDGIGLAVEVARAIVKAH